MNHQAKDDPAHVLKGARILIVEDEFLIAMELDSILLEAGAEVVGPCRSTAEAHSLLGKVEGIRAAILDWRLGKDTSIPLTRHLKRHGVPFVFFTGQVDMSPIHAEYPAAKIISKPFQRRAILAALADIMESG